MKRLALTFGLLSLAAVLAACSGASAAQETPSPAASGGPSSGSVTIVAKDLAFVTPAVTAKAGTAFSLIFDNRDGAPHNVAILDASGAKVFKGDIVAGQQVTYQVPALAAGSYGFICEVHPNMKGTLTVQ